MSQLIISQIIKATYLIGQIFLSSTQKNSMFSGSKREGESGPPFCYDMERKLLWYAAENSMKKRSVKLLNERLKCPSKDCEKNLKTLWWVESGNKIKTTIGDTRDTVLVANIEFLHR